MSVNKVSTQRPQGRQARQARQTRTRSPRNTTPTSATPPVSTASTNATPQQAPITPLAYSMGEARKILSLSHYSLYQLIGSGALKSIAVGGSSKKAGRRIIPLAAIEEYLRCELAAQNGQPGEDGGRNGAA